MKFCSKNGIIVDGVDEGHPLTEGKCVEVLRAGAKMLKAARKASEGQSALTGNEDDSELVARVKSLEIELRLALGAAEDIKALKAKLLQLVDRIRSEKEHKLRAETQLGATKKKLDILSDHIEKLMIFLKHEAAAKVRCTESLRIAEKEILGLKDKCDLIQSKSNAKDKFIIELREGSKVLEDQLRLMDEKYLELRTKLDYAREVGTKRVKDAERKASELRTKFALAGNTMVLDSMPLPTMSQMIPSMSMNGSGMGKSVSMNMNSLSYDQPPSAVGKKSGKMSKKMKHSQSVGINSSMSVNDDISLDDVMEKLRLQQGTKKDWTEDQIRALTHPK